MYQTSDNRERKNRIGVFLSDEEKDVLLKKMSDAHSNNVSDFIRDLILYGQVNYIDYKDLYNAQTSISKIETYILRLGNNINQIAKVMNSTGKVYIQDVREIKKSQEYILNRQSELGDILEHALSDSMNIKATGEKIKILTLLYSLLPNYIEGTNEFADMDAHDKWKYLCKNIDEISEKFENDIKERLGDYHGRNKNTPNKENH